MEKEEALEVLDNSKYLVLPVPVTKIERNHDVNLILKEELTGKKERVWILFGGVFGPEWSCLLYTSFMVRVGTLMMQMNAKEKVIENKTGMTSEEQVKEILARVCLLEKKKAKIYEQLMGELEPKGIRIINFNRLSNEEGSLLERCV